MPSYYEILGVPEDADADAITRAYSAAVREATTADGGPGAQVRRLDEAYAVLGTPARRRRYDELRAAEEGGGGNPELLALLAVIAETGRLPTVEEVVGPPVPDREPEARPAAPPAARDPEPTAPPAARESAPAPAVEEREPAPRPTQGPRSGAPSPATPRAAPRLPGTDADRRALGRRRTAVAGALVGLLVGVAAGVLLAGGGGTLPLDAGACVSLAEEEGRAVACTSADADAVVSSLTDDASRCEPSPAGYLVRADGRVACLTER